MKYQSSDGKLWDAEDACREHERAVLIVEDLDNCGVDLRQSGSLYSIVKTLIDRGHITLPPSTALQ